MQTFCSKSFKKIRIRKKNIKPLKSPFQKLIDERNYLSNLADDENKDKLEELTRKISELEAEENRNKLIKNFKEFSDNPETINLQQVWKTLKRIWPKTGSSLPVAKKNHRGKIVSGPKDIKKLLAKEYKDRLRKRPMRPDLQSLRIRRKRIFDLKLKLSQSNRSPDWLMSDLDLALSNLKLNKSRDPEGYLNEIFKQGVIGDNLKTSLLIMMNRLKRQKLIPKVMNYVNVTTVPKKGSRLLLTNERGIFRVSIIRAILMRLIYNTKYNKIDQKMSDCQMGARKRKGCKNNIFMINGIIHEVLKSKKMKPVVLGIFDYEQMFDSIDLEEALNDIYNTGVDDDTFPLLHQANAEVYMAVKTPTGLTERQDLHDTVLQGDTWGSLLASVQVDSIGQECMKSGYFYKYKNKLPIGFLGLVDDIVGITEVGYKSQQLNALINLKTAEKSLQFGVKKCKSMLICRDGKSDLFTDLMVDKWDKEYEENPETGELQLVETYKGQTKVEQTETQTYLGFVISSTGNNMANIEHLKKKSIGVIKKIFNKLNSLRLQKYYFECAMILLNVVLRPSILYACEAYYNLKEKELRQIERIEENFLRKVLNTTRGCPIVQLYLETGHIPARLEIQKIRLLYLQYILQQPEESSLLKFLKLQLESPTRGDWASTCIQDLKKLNIEQSFENIKLMTKYKFIKLLNERIQTGALKYLLGKQGVKGQEISYSRIQLSDYLLPINDKQTIEQKRRLFAVRNKMVNIPSNFSSSKTKIICYCGDVENMEHIYQCDSEVILPYNLVYNGSIEEQIEVYNIFEDQLERRTKMNETEFPCDPPVIRSRSFG